MLYFFKSTKILCYVLFVTGGLAILLLCNPIMFMDIQIPSPIIHPIWIIPLLFLWFFIVTISCNAIAQKKANKITSLMMNECNIEAYIDKYKILLNGKLHKNFKARVLLNLATGYLYAGDSVAAKQTLDQIQNIPDNAAGAIDKACYYNNFFIYYMLINNVAKAEETLQKMQDALKNKKIPPALRDSLYMTYMGKQFICNMEKGNYEGAAQFLTMVLQKSGTTLEKVSAQCTLGKIYLHDGDVEKANEALKFVIDHGGSSRYVAEAKSLLQKINGIADLPKTNSVQDN